MSVIGGGALSRTDQQHSLQNNPYFQINNTRPPAPPRGSTDAGGRGHRKSGSGSAGGY